MSKVKLVSVTKPEVEGIENAEDIVAYCARVSNPSNQMNTETAPKLIKYLIKHKHWSPFELASMCVEISTSRAIAAQILRHRSFSFQEFSQRYSQATELEELELRSPALKNRQSSSEPFDENHDAYKYAEASIESSLATYKTLIEMGVAKETARGVLPLTTKTTMYMNGTLRSWVHYIDLRSAEDTQKEHRDIANEIKKIFINKFPNISEALEWNKK
tara:strand:+ start:72 stop:722 length:651 start_codon:yes stop_codon:yes gene_type:complete